MNKEELLVILNKFYISIENCKWFEFKDEYNYIIREYECFPNWRCDSTSEILRKFLNEEYNINFNYRKSEYNHWNYHIYLINNELLIDFTASQFNSDKFPEFCWKIFPKIILLDWKEKDKYIFEKKNISHKYEESFIITKNYIDFYNLIIKDYKNKNPHIGIVY